MVKIEFLHFALAVIQMVSIAGVKLPSIKGEPRGGGQMLQRGLY